MIRYTVLGPRQLLGVRKQFMFYEAGLLALRPTPKHHGGPLGCFFVWVLTTNLPDIGM
jgi:hypothetical protein